MDESRQYELITIGVSAGGMQALSTILIHLPCEFSIPILIVQHTTQGSNQFLVDYLNNLCALSVIEAEDKLTINPGTIYLAPAGYHMLVENKQTIALAIFPKVNYSLPSIDVLFESAADVFRSKLIGIILTGANHDGVKGAQKIKSLGGYVIVQSLESAYAKFLPKNTIETTSVDKVLNLDEIGPFLKKLGDEQCMKKS